MVAVLLSLRLKEFRNLIKERGIPIESALANARAIHLMDSHRMGSNGRQPIEDFLDIMQIAA